MKESIKAKLKEHAKRLLIIPPLLIGAAAIVIAVKTKDKPVQAPLSETAVKVRVIPAPSLDVVPRALGYGTVLPGKVWQAVAEVGGKVTEIHPQLKKGAIIPAGELLLKIDPAAYHLAARQIEANIRSTEAQLAELAVKEENTGASLKIDERSLTLSRKDLDRKKQLLKRKTVSQASVDQEERNVLSRQQSVQSLRNTLNLIPSERQALQAQLALNRAQLEQAKLDLEHTVIKAPFDGRVAEINVELAQYASTGKVLAVMDSIDVSEVTAQLSIDKMLNVVARSDSGLNPTSDVMDRLPDFLGLSPVVRLHAGDFTVEWPGRLSRISDTVDPQTRTIGVIIAVDNPYGQARPGIRPPLAKNMYVEVELRGRPRPAQIVVPRVALHGRQVYVVNGESRLEKRPVDIAFLQTNFAVLRGGLKAGERIVISDLIPAVGGMLVKPVEDAEAARALAREATGDSPVR